MTAVSGTICSSAQPKMAAKPGTMKRPAIKDVLRGLFIPMGINNGCMYGWMKVPEYKDCVLVRLDGEYWQNPTLMNCKDAGKAFKIFYVMKNDKGAVMPAPVGKYYWRSDACLRALTQAKGASVTQKRKITDPKAIQTVSMVEYPSAAIEKRFNGAARRLAELHKTAA